MLRPSSTDSTPRGQAYDVTDRTKRFSIRQQLTRRPARVASATEKEEDTITIRNVVNTTGGNLDKLQVDMCKDKIDENIIALEHYLRSPTPPETSISLNISTGTVEAIENAEKLLQEATEKIDAASYAVPWFDTSSNGSSTSSASDLDDSELHIRQLVTTKLREVNRRCNKKLLKKNQIKTSLLLNSKKLSTKNNNDNSRVVNKMSTNTGIARKKPYQSPRKAIESYRKGYSICDDKSGKKKICNNTLQRKCKFESFNHVNDNAKVLTKVSTQTNTHSNNNNSKINAGAAPLSIRNLAKLHSQSQTYDSKNTKSVKAFAFEREQTDEAEVREEEKQKYKIDESLIDAAIQTSLQEQNVPSNEEIKNLQLSATACASYSRRNIENMPLSHDIQAQRIDEKLKTTKITTEKNKDNEMHVNKRKINSNNNNIVSKNKVTKGTFIQFLCHITKNLNQPLTAVENDIIDDKSQEDDVIDELDIEKLDLNAPNIIKFDKMLFNIDKNIQLIIKDTDKLENLFSDIKHYDKVIGKTDLGMKNKKTTDMETDETDEILFLDNKRLISSRSHVESPKKKNHFCNTNDDKEISDKLSEIDVRFTRHSRSRISSYESVSSDYLTQHAKFSTPLNNYRNKVDHDKKNTQQFSTIINDNEIFFIPQSSFQSKSSQLNVNADNKNTDANVFITRNKFSSISSVGDDENTEDHKKTARKMPITTIVIDDTKEENCDLKKVNEKFDEKYFHAASFSSDDREKVKSKFDSKVDNNNEIKSVSKEFQMSNRSIKKLSIKNFDEVLDKMINKNSNTINNVDNNDKNCEIVIEKSHEEKSEKSLLVHKSKNNSLLKDELLRSTSRPDEKMDIEKKINPTDEKNNLTPESSNDDIHERTSYDISGIYSESFEELISEIKSVSKAEVRCVNKNENFQTHENEVDVDEKTYETKTKKDDDSKSIIHSEKKCEEKLADTSNSKSEQLNKNEQNNANIVDEKNSCDSVEDQVTVKINNNNNNNDNDHNNKKIFDIARGDDKKIERSFLSSSSTVSNFNNSYEKLPTNLTSFAGNTKINETKVTLNSDDFSEGEIRLPSTSCSHSLGEVKIIRPRGNDSKGSYVKQVNFSNQISTISHSPVQSPGEVEETDMESILSFESRGQIA